MNATQTTTVQVICPHCRHIAVMPRGVVAECGKCGKTFNVPKGQEVSDCMKRKA